VAGPAKKLAPELRARIQQRAERICRTLELDEYCRIDTAEAHLLSPARAWVGPAAYPISIESKLLTTIA
jgi:hypothetical protein